MKKTTTFFGAILIASIVFISCGNSEKKTDSESERKKITTEVPSVLSSNNKVSEYFATLDLFMEEYISMVESLVEAGREAEKKGGELSFGSMMNMAADLTGSMMKMAPLLERLDELEKEADILKGDMTSEELVAFMNTYAKIMIRIAEMGQKLQ